jgi:hypothetical protein
VLVSTPLFWRELKDVALLVNSLPFAVSFAGFDGYGVAADSAE